MAHAIDRDALHAKLVKAVDAWAKGCEATVRPLTARLIARLKNSKATTPISKIVDDEMKKLGIDASLRKSMRELVIDAVAHGYGILPTMMADRDKVGDKLMTTPWSGDDMTLSERLYQNAKHMRAVVADSIQAARRQGQTFTQAARVLYDGYNSGQRVIDAAKLPQYMQNVEQAARHVLSGGDLRDFQREMRRAQRAVDRLAKGGAPNKALKSAYRQMLNAAETGSERHLERAIRTAVEERSRYHAERIARTEAARAYFDGFIARNASDDDVIGYKWTIGGRHPKTDICDDHAAADNFHMGAGVYPKDKVPAYPAHPHCLCHLSEVYADEVVGYKKPEGAAAIEGRVEAGEIEKPKDKAVKAESSVSDEQRYLQDREWKKASERVRKLQGIIDSAESTAPFIKGSQDQADYAQKVRESILQKMGTTIRDVYKDPKRLDEFNKLYAVEIDKFFKTDYKAYFSAVAKIDDARAALNNVRYRYDPLPTDPRQCKSLEQAAQFALKNGLAKNADFAGLAQSAANEINAVVLDEIKRHPKMGNMLDYLGSGRAEVSTFKSVCREKYIESQRSALASALANPQTAASTEKRIQASADAFVKRLSMSRIDSGALGHFRSYEKMDVTSLVINEKHFSESKMQQSLDRLRDGVKWKHNPISCDTLKSVVEHELGHALSYLAKTGSDAELIKLYNEHMLDMEDALSKYARHSVGEMIAEGYAESLNNPKPRELSIKIRQILETAYNATT